jgi:hypothetical protein
MRRAHGGLSDRVLLCRSGLRFFHPALASEQAARDWLPD